MSARDPAAARPLLWEIDPRRPRPERRLDLYAAVGVGALASVAYVAALLMQFVPPRGLSVVFFAAAPISAAFALVVLAVRWRGERDPDQLEVQWGVHDTRHAAAGHDHANRTSRGGRTRRRRLLGAGRSCEKERPHRHRQSAQSHRFPPRG